MSDPSPVPATDPLQAAYQEGRRLGLATGALALSIVAFVNLLGIEKSVLAAVLAVLSLQGGGPAVRLVTRRGRAALAIAALHAATVVVVLILFHQKLLQLLHLLQKLG